MLFVTTSVVPIVVLALGRRDETVRLTEPLAVREAAARERLPREALLIGITPVSSTSAA